MFQEHNDTFQFSLTPLRHPVLVLRYKIDQSIY